ncbi:MAG: TIGR04348 family glycosyltransferase [Pirellulaceae bacterium]|nr:TIGR04348 family glycosyltransferase [Pirellulaceae bacterium]
MNVLLVTPSVPGSRSGNQMTTLRWCKLLRRLGLRVTVENKFDGQKCDLLIALHARRSFSSIRRFHRVYPDRRMVVALTGTDLYYDLPRRPHLHQALEWATRLVVLQHDATRHLPNRLKSKARVIYQSASPYGDKVAPLKDVFEVCVLGHLRSVKDPFRAAMAARRLPRESRICIEHFGAALTPAMERRALREIQRNHRYHWHGDIVHRRTQRRLARSRLLVVSSKLEGGANVVSEAIAANVPVLSTRISGTIGLLGKDYPGYFDVGDTAGLTELLARAEADPRFYRCLQTACQRKSALVQPKHELDSWRAFLRELEMPGNI